MRNRLELSDIPSSYDFDVAPAKQLRRPPSDAASRRPQKRQIASIETLPAAAPGRVASVDALRGFCMICILGSDNLAKALREMLSDKGVFFSTLGEFIGGQFEHAEWEGFRFYDLVFPMFIFVTGVAIVFSLSRLVEREGKPVAHRRVLRRSLLLFLLGVICYGGVSQTFGDVRLGGVLQRIALCYLFASLLFLNFPLRGLIVACACLLLGYWALLAFVPVPGIGAGSYAENANLANWIDLHYLPGRLWEKTWDPEGMLSTLPAIGTCLLGVFTGLLLKNSRLRPEQRSLALIAGGAAMFAAGLLWGLQFPIIKNIWTSSFVLVAGGFSAVMLGVFHQVIDVWGRKAWATAFLWVGASAIVLYVFNMIAGFHPLAMRLVGGDVARFLDQQVTQGMGNFIGAVVTLGLAIAAGRFLYRRKIFLRV
jgi:predicted acyltransferase